jgi:AcrR family transcriptional regulator
MATPARDGGRLLPGHPPGIKQPAGQSQRRPRRGRPRDPSVDAAILKAAVHLLGEVGYARVTMDEVASRAGVSKASLYLRWQNKVALVAEAIRDLAQPVPEVPDTGNLPSDMRAFLRGLQRSRSAASKAVTAVSGELANSPELRAAWRRGVSGLVVERLRTIITRAIERGELTEDADVDLLSMLPLALMQTWRIEHGRELGHEVFERIVRQFYSPSPKSTARDQDAEDDQ